jgi:hypothetical protein
MEITLLWLWQLLWLWLGTVRSQCILKLSVESDRVCPLWMDCIGFIQLLLAQQLWRLGGVYLRDLFALTLLFSESICFDLGAWSPQTGTTGTGSNKRGLVH